MKLFEMKTFLYTIILLLPILSHAQCPPDTSYNNIVICDSNFTWNENIYTESGAYFYNDFSPTNYSMNFDGLDDNIILSNNDSLPIDDLTICLWFKSRETPEDPEYIFTSDNNEAYSLKIENDIVYFSISGFTQQGFPTRTTFGRGFSVGDWHHFAATFSSNTIKFYLDGDNLGSSFGSSIDSIGFENGSLNIGSIADSSFFNGLLDEFQIWNYGLTSSEIEQYMICPPIGNEAGLVGYWNFEEGIGTTSYDLSSITNNGTINGAIFNTDVPSQSCNLTNVNGCDSVDVLNLTINTSTASFFFIQGLDSYTAPSGAIYTTGGIYYDTIPNAAGCDSIITLDLSLNYTGINELNTAPKKVTKIIDFLGRELNCLEPNVPLIYIYDDGSTETKITLE
tara:strand:+ start:76 stop:1260 length:1185 start_codon:yes stop_codon:yes gene_type:complete